jgi:hypothetical protein
MTWIFHLSSGNITVSFTIQLFFNKREGSKERPIIRHSFARGGGEELYGSQMEPVPSEVVE